MEKDNDLYQEPQIWKGSKKKVDEDEDNNYNSKKGKKWKKNRNRKKELQEGDEDAVDKPTGKPSVIKHFTSEITKQQQMVRNLHSVYSDLPEKAIRDCLQKSNFNMQEAAEMIIENLEQESSEMSDMFQKQEKVDQQSKPKHQKKKEGAPRNSQVEAQQLLDSMIGQKDFDMSGFEFEELFDEITQIIKEDQREKGKDLIEINNFVDNCNTAKDAILVGMNQVFEWQDEIHIDEKDPIYARLQQFILETNEREAEQEFIKAEQFPSLGESASKKSNQGKNQQFKPEPKRSIVNELQAESQGHHQPITKADFFKQKASQTPAIFQQKNQKGIFNVDNQLHSEDALKELHNEYKHVSIQTLKVTYISLEKDYNLCKKFLKQYYGSQNQPQQRVVVESRRKRSEERRHSSRSHTIARFRKESEQEIDSSLREWSLAEIRDEVEHLYLLRQAFRITSNKISNSKQRAQLFRMAEQKAPTAILRKLCKASRVRLIQQSLSSNPNYIDLHGHREEEVDSILEGMIAGMREQFDRGNEKLKTKSYGGRKQAVLQVMTGKGRHSHDGKSVLKPYIVNWCRNNDIRAIENEDNVEIYIPLM